MPRPLKLRQIAATPAVTFFKPVGVPMGALEIVVLALEEAEAIRLKDIEDLHQEECAQRMGVSRATFHQVLKTARSKLADAILNGKAIKVEGGAFAFPGGWFRCRRDGSEWMLPAGPLPGVSSVSCPTCSSREVHPVPGPGGPLHDGGGPGRRGRGWQGPWGRPVPGSHWQARGHGPWRHSAMQPGIVPGDDGADRMARTIEGDRGEDTVEGSPAHEPCSESRHNTRRMKEVRDAKR